MADGLDVVAIGVTDEGAEVVGWYSGNSRGSWSTSAPAATASSNQARTVVASVAVNPTCTSRLTPTSSKVEIQNVGWSVP